ncbi:MAG: response regulator transcription factor [Anaerolineae bacterium]
MKTILLVEDALDLAETIRRELISNGYQVHHVTDGLAALERFSEDTPQLVILDWMLPGLDGLEVLRRMREQAPTPIMMLTARDEETDRVLGLELGADDYLTKPFSMRELLARVRAMFRRSELLQQTLAADRAGDDTVMKVGPLLIDPVAYRATLEGISLDLTRTEFLLLHLLLRNPGRTFSRDYLLDVVWGQSYVEGDRAVDNAILRLRRKLQSWGHAIETVWGIGYRWQPDSTDTLKDE